MIHVDSTDIECDGPCDRCDDDEYDEGHVEIDGEVLCPSCYLDHFGD